ncbi:MAG TPA: xylose isomerase, partial [Planctomycetota bacterium]|nr:xylose isomerase [Planctomycetota bacterium]
ERGAVGPADAVRCHFHVPIYARARAPLDVTSDRLGAVVAHGRAAGCRHFETETYTFDVLPPAMRSAGLADHLAAELAFAAALFDGRPA